VVVDRYISVALTVGSVVDEYRIKIKQTDVDVDFRMSKKMWQLLFSV
jgi:hypothetical protein